MGQYIPAAYTSGCIVLFIGYITNNRQGAKILYLERV